MQLSIYHHAKGVRTEGGMQIVYDLGENVMHYGSAKIGGPALRWAIEKSSGVDALLTVRLSLDRSMKWLLRCDRVDFPPGGIAYTHTHQGPGIRCLLSGEIRIKVSGEEHLVRPGEAWFEAGPDPVLALASEREPTAFARVMVLPAELRGKSSIRYVLPEDADKPKRQTYQLFVDDSIAC